MIRVYSLWPLELVLALGEAGMACLLNYGGGKTR